MSSNKKELNFIVVTGPTATGKTKVAVNIAYQFGGEIISADSRQIYRGMEIGTGKDLNEYNIKDTSIQYHLIDILDPEDNYSVYQFRNDFFDCWIVGFWFPKENYAHERCFGTFGFLLF